MGSDDDAGRVSTVTLSSPTYQIGSWGAGDTGLVDQFGTAFAIRPQGTTGIFDGAGVRLNQTPFPDFDGNQRSDSFDTAQTIVLNGWAIGASVAGTIASRRAFVSLFSGGRQQTLTITELDGSVLTCQVEKADIPRATPAISLEFDWQLTLLASDPRKYLPASSSSTGLPTSSGGIDYTGGGSTGEDYTGAGGEGIDYGTAGLSGLIQLANPGTAEAWPTFTFKGPTDTGKTLVNPGAVSGGDTLATTLVLVTGDALVITTHPLRRTVRLNGVPYRRFLTTAEWFSVPPGGSINVQFLGTSDSVTCQLVASLAPAIQ